MEVVIFKIPRLDVFPVSPHLLRSWIAILSKNVSYRFLLPFLAKPKRGHIPFGFTVPEEWEREHLRQSDSDLARFGIAPLPRRSLGEGC